MSGDTPVFAKAICTFDAPPARIFDAWLDPVMINTFMFVPTLKDEELISITTDPQVGGTFSFKVNRKGTIIDHAGRYLEMRKPERLVFTWGVKEENTDGSSKVMIDIVKIKQGAVVTLTHLMAPQWAAYLDRSKEAWTIMLNALSDALDK